MSKLEKLHARLERASLWKALLEAYSPFPVRDWAAKSGFRQPTGTPYNEERWTKEWLDAETRVNLLDLEIKQLQKRGE